MHPNMQTNSMWDRIRPAANCCTKLACLALFLAVGSVAAARQDAGSSDVYVAPRRFYAQQLVEQVKAKHPELIYLNLRTVPPDRSESFKVASSPPSRGGKSDQADLDAQNGKPLVQQIKDAPQEFRVLLPLRERSGKIIGNIAMRMKLPPGKTTADALELGRKVDREPPERHSLESEAVRTGLMGSIRGTRTEKRDLSVQHHSVFPHHACRLTRFFAILRAQFRRHRPDFRLVSLSVNGCR